MLTVQSDAFIREKSLRLAGAFHGLSRNSERASRCRNSSAYLI